MLERKICMWTTVYMTQSIDTARAIRRKMEECKILVMLRSIKFNDRAGEDCFEILVPSAELKEALDIIIAE